MENKECIFCKIIRREIKADIVGESNSFIAFLDANPKTKGHTLIIPKNHCVTLLDIPDKFGLELLSFMKKISSDIMGKKQGDGFNVIMNNLEPAGQVVKHAHIHIIPRKEGDNLNCLV